MEISIGTYFILPDHVPYNYPAKVLEISPRVLTYKKSSAFGKYVTQENVVKAWMDFMEKRKEIATFNVHSPYFTLENLVSKYEGALKLMKELLHFDERTVAIMYPRLMKDERDRHSMSVSDYEKRLRLIVDELLSRLDVDPKRMYFRATMYYDDKRVYTENLISVLADFKVPIEVSLTDIFLEHLWNAMDSGVHSFKVKELVARAEETVMEIIDHNVKNVGTNDIRFRFGSAMAYSLRKRGREFLRYKRFVYESISFYLMEKGLLAIPSAIQLQALVEPLRALMEVKDVDFKVYGIFNNTKEPIKSRIKYCIEYTELLKEMLKVAVKIREIIRG
ncbi:hypothetical protein EYM_01380 [Ignicoccus islandicus DSM 13165]|uniref:Uncharacterized protein n=1 Tax=Ignicoccus islandicus DSM 13165 TaxID=940295 RepID=A0A0U3EA66_9CREN|nr:hypothetical protein [Ignicoccus islandicus]ALU12206.1 hypothetical protein EYM_01380 [Ignicoccus islandicus DSM 13165]